MVPPPHRRLGRHRFEAESEFLADLAGRSHLKPVTIRRYGVKLRKIVFDLGKLEESAVLLAAGVQMAWN